MDTRSSVELSLTSNLTEKAWNLKIGLTVLCDCDNEVGRRVVIATGLVDLVQRSQSTRWEISEYCIRMDDDDISTAESSSRSYQHNDNRSKKYILSSYATTTNVTVITKTASTVVNDDNETE